MVWPIVAIVGGLILLVWSADRFVDGSAGLARHLGMSPLLIGMLIVGFGTSTPELLVSTLASLQGNSGLALGNAYGSNITNIALILGLTAMISPIRVHSDILRKELPLLTVVTAGAILLMWDYDLSRLDGVILLVAFAGLMAWTVWLNHAEKKDSLALEMDQEMQGRANSIRSSVFWAVIGLLVLLVSSRLLVWGAVKVAHQLGVSDLIIGLTVVAVGTSLPELASSLMAIRKSEHDIALGNVIGSNLFNTLAVVGIAGVIHPLEVEAAVVLRDMAVMGVLTLSVFVVGFGFRGAGTGRINRVEGGILFASYIAYTIFLIRSVGSI